MKNIYKSIAVSIAVLSVLSAARPTIIICQETKKSPPLSTVELKIKEEEVVAYTSKDLYDTFKAHQAKLQISNELSKQLNIDEQIIKYAFEEAQLYIDDNCTMEEYYELVAVVLATMDVESSFEQDIACSNTNKTTDYGIMQVNNTTIQDIKKVLGNAVDYYKSDIKHNIKAGTYEAMLCWKKAKENHPDDVPFYSYAYYNRGLYYENKNFNINERYKRSMKFKKKYYKYFDICNNYELVIN